MATSNSNLENVLAEVERATVKDPTAHGYYFEYISDYALTQGPTFGRDIKTIERYEDWARRERPDLTATLTDDNGVDKIIVTHTGEIWAVQNKGYGEHKENSYTELATFLAQARDIVKADKLLWVTSGPGLNRKAADHNRLGGVGVIVLNRGWLATEVDYPATLAGIRAALEDDVAPRPAQQAYPLRRDQQIARDTLRKELDVPGTHSVQYISACGTGKTVTTHALHNALGSNLTAFFVPTLSLMRQTMRSWRKQSDLRPITVIALCSEDDILTNRDTGEALGEHLIRDPGELAATIRAAERLTYLDERCEPRVRPIVIFSTYQSSSILIDAQHRHGAPEVDLAIADEAHYLAGVGEFGELIKWKPDGRLRLRAAKRCYATATPKHVPEEYRGVAGIDSMDPDSPVFGKRAYTMTFGEAIQLGILSGYQLSIVVVPDEAVAHIEVNRGVHSADGRSVGARSLAAVFALQRAMADGHSHWVTYHSRVERAQAFAELLQREGVNFAAAVHGGQSAARRDDIIGRFVTETRGAVLTNVRVLNEGVDIPQLNGVMFVDPKSQTTDIVQSIGRALRKHPSKGLGQIIVPVPLSADEFTADMNVETISRMMGADSRWKTVFDVIQALGEHDTVVAQEIEVLFNELQPTEYRERKRGGADDGATDTDPDTHNSRIVLDFGLAEQLGEAFRDRLRQGLTLAVQREVLGQWSVRYTELKLWLEGHSGRYPAGGRTATTGERHLAGWVSAQVNEYRADVLRPERAAYLNDLPGWPRKAMTTHQLLVLDLTDYTDWHESHRRPPAADSADPVEAHLGARIPALTRWLSASGVSLAGLRESQ